MRGWLGELKAQWGGEAEEVNIHVVGTKSDIVAEDPARRKVPFERTIAYVAEQLHPSKASTPPATMASLHAGGHGAVNPSQLSPSSKRSSGFWGQDVGWNSCHEVNARDGEGIEEVFRVIAKRLIEQRNQRWEKEQALATGIGGSDGAGDDDFNGPVHSKNGSFRVGHGDKRRSWLGLPTVASLGIGDDGGPASYETRTEE